MLCNNNQLGYYSGEVEEDKARMQVLLQMNRELNKRKRGLMEEVSAELGHPFEMPLLPEAAELLLDAGANPEHEDICGRKPLQRADSERMRQLLEHYCVNPRR